MNFEKALKVLGKWRMGTALLLTVLAAVACQAEEAEEADEPEDSADAEATENIDTVILRAAHATTEDSPYGVTVDFIDERLDELTDGAVRVEEHAGAALGDETETLDLYGTGDIDIGFHLHSAIAPAMQEFGFLDTPFLWESEEQWASVFDSDEGLAYWDSVLEAHGADYQVGFVGLAGVRNVYATEAVIDDLDVLNGLQIRLPESPVISAVWEELGASPTALPWGDVYSALETGLVDAGENSPAWFVDANHHEVAPEYNITEHMFSSTFVFISDQALESLPDDMEEAFWQVVHEAKEHMMEAQRQADDSAAAQFDEFGVTLHELPDDVTESIQETAEPFAEQFAEELDAQEFLDIVEAHSQE